MRILSRTVNMWCHSATEWLFTSKFLRKHSVLGRRTHPSCIFTRVWHAWAMTSWTPGGTQETPGVTQGTPQGNLHRETSTGRPPQGNLHGNLHRKPRQGNLPRETSTGKHPRETPTVRDKASKSVAKTDVCCTWRHPSVAKGHIHIKTTTKHWENEGPAHEARIFTRRSMFRALYVQIYLFLLRNEGVFSMHFYDGYCACITHRTHVWLLFIPSSIWMIFLKTHVKYNGFRTSENNDKTGML